MIEAVCLQANKLYRLWVARNPDFDKNGHVHIIGHSVSLSHTAMLILARLSTCRSYPIEPTDKDAFSGPAAETGHYQNPRSIHFQYK
jgi:hypothetical protein